MSKEVPFESMLRKLEGVVKKLESGEVSLEDSLKFYEEGVGLVRNAQQRLEKMEGKIEQLMNDGKKKPLQVAVTSDRGQGQDA